MELEPNRSVLTRLIVFTMVTLFGQSASIAGCRIQELGVKVPSRQRIPDKYMTSSTRLNKNYQAFRGRIGIKRIGSLANAWCSSEADSAPYIQVYFEFLTKVKVIESEGVDVDGDNMWVRSYAVSTSNDSVGGWIYHGSSVTQLWANTDIHGTNVTLNDSWEHFIRIHPKQHIGKWTCMRIALYGCQNEQQVHTIDKDVFKDAQLAKTPHQETLLLALPAVVFIFIVTAGFMCLFRRYRARRKAETKQSALAETNNGIKSIVIYEDPPPYESQTVSLHFGNDVNLELGREISSEMPAFTESNKIFSFERGQSH